MHCPDLQTFYVPYISITRTLHCYVFKKTKPNSKSEHWKMECLFIIRPKEEEAQWGDAVRKGRWVKGQVLVTDSLLKISDSWKHSCLWPDYNIPPGSKKSKSVQQCTCSSVRVDYVQYVQVITISVCLLTLTYFTVWSHMCLIKSMCIFRDSRGEGGATIVGPSVWESAWRRPEITNSLNNLDWPKTQSICEYLWESLSLVDVLRRCPKIWALCRYCVQGKRSGR